MRDLCKSKIFETRNTKYKIFGILEKNEKREYITHKNKNWINKTEYLKIITVFRITNAITKRYKIGQYNFSKNFQISNAKIRTEIFHGTLNNVITFSFFHYHVCFCRREQAPGSAFRYRLTWLMMFLLYIPPSIIIEFNGTAEL